MASAKLMAGVGVSTCATSVVLLWLGGGGFEERAMILPIGWGVAEISIRFSKATPSMANFIRYTFAWIGMMLALALAAKTFISLDFLKGDAVAFVRRFVGVLLGTGIVLWGNFLPKIPAPSLHAPEFPWLRTHRFMGWVAVLGGILVIVMYIFTPGQIISNMLIPLVATITAVVVARRILGVLLTNLQRNP